MRNMGLDQLVIVDPPAWDPETARWMAPGCDEMLSQIRVVATLDEALEGVHLALASTARHRKQGQAVLTPDQAASQILDDAQVGHTTAILFGREDFGLATADVIRCEALLRIPTPEHASLNLGQAVLLCSWALFSEARSRGGRFEGRTLGGSRAKRTTDPVQPNSPREAPADLVQVEPAVQEILGLLDRVGYLRGVQPDKARLTARQSLQRARMPMRHVEALRGMLARIEWALENPGLDWKQTKRRRDSN